MDFIRAIAVHPTYPYIISASDDTNICIRDWSNDFNVVATLEGHSGFVMSLALNPKDHGILASASADSTIRIWGIPAPGQASGQSTQCHFKLIGHTDSVNCVTYTTAGDHPYILSGSDDATIKVWDFQSKKCLQTLQGHTQAVFSITSHPTLPVFISTSEDETLKVWHNLKFSCETTHALQMGRLWMMTSPPKALPGVSNHHSPSIFAIACDNGVAVIQLGSDHPVVSLNSGQLVWAKGLEIEAANLRIVEESTLVDGERVRMPVKDMGTCDVYPQHLSHHPQGRFFAVCGDGEFYVYATRSLRSKCFGKATEFIWGSGGQFAVRDGSDGADKNRLVVYHDCQEKFAFKPSYAVEAMWGGPLLAVRSNEDFVCFYDWEEGRLIRRIDVSASYNLAWNKEGNRVAIACSDGIYTLSCNLSAIKESVEAAAGSAEDEEDEGVEDAFEMIDEIPERNATSLCWSNEECLAFTSNGGLKLCAAVGGTVEVIAHLDRVMSIIGSYDEDSERLVLVDDRDLNVTTYKISHALARWQSAISKKDLEAVKTLWPSVSHDCHERAAKFLIRQGMKAQALKISSDPQLRFDLATELGQLPLAAQITKDQLASTVAAEGAAAHALAKRRWILIGDLALQQGALGLATEAFEQAEDLNSWLLVASCTGDAASMRKILTRAQENGEMSVAFTAANLLQQTDTAIDVLVRSDEFAEAALYARTYKPSMAAEITSKQWVPQVIEPANPLFAEATAIPGSTAAKGLFPDFERIEHIEMALAKRKEKCGLGTANIYLDLRQRGVQDLDLIATIKSSPNPPLFFKQIGADIYSQGSNA